MLSLSASPEELIEAEIDDLLGYIKKNDPLALAQDGSSLPNGVIESKGIFDSKLKGLEDATECLALQTFISTDAKYTSSGELDVSGERTLGNVLAIIPYEKSGTFLSQRMFEGKTIDEAKYHRLITEDKILKLYTYIFTFVQVQLIRTRGNFIALSLVVKQIEMEMKELDQTGAPLGVIGYLFDSESAKIK